MDAFVPMSYDFRSGQLTFSCVNLALHQVRAKVSFRPCVLITSIAKRMDFQFTETFHARYFVLDRSLQNILAEHNITFTLRKTEFPSLKFKSSPHK